MPATTILVRTLSTLATLCFIHQALHATESFGSIGNAPINSIIGDRSFVHRFGRLPLSSDPERLRIATHLAYVEELLRSRDAGDLPPALRAERLRNLDRLHRYRQRGTFPNNNDYPEERRPCFIDRNGTICAVGYLVEQSKGRAVAERINSEFQYATIHEMRSPELAGWVATSGLTLEEAAMIQPGYYNEPSAYVGVSGGVTAAIHSGMRMPEALQGHVEPAGTEFDLNPYASLHALLSFNPTHNWGSGLMLRLSYDDRSITIDDPAHDYSFTGSNGEPRTLNMSYYIEADYRLISAELLWAQRIGETGLSLLVGPSVGIPLSTRRRDAYLPVQGMATSHESDAPFISPQWGLEGGIQYELSRRSRLLIIPSIFYKVALTHVRTGEPWRSDALGIGIDLRYALNGGWEMMGCSGE